MVSGVSSVSTYKPIAGVKRKRADEEAVGQIERPYKRPKTDSNGWSTGQRRIVKARLKPVSARPSGWQNNLPSPQSDQAKATKLDGKITIAASDAKPQGSFKVGFVAQGRGERPEAQYSDTAEKQTPTSNISQKPTPLQAKRVPLGEISSNAASKTPSLAAAKSQYSAIKHNPAPKAAGDVSTLSKPQHKEKIDTAKDFIKSFIELKAKNGEGLLKEKGQEHFSHMRRMIPEIMQKKTFKGHEISAAEKRVLGALLRTPTNLLKAFSTLQKKQSKTVLSPEERKTLRKLKQDIATAAKDGALDGVPLTGKDKENIENANKKISKLLKTEDGDIKTPEDLLKAFDKLAKKEEEGELSPKEKKLFNKIKNAILEALETGSFNGKKLSKTDVKNLKTAKSKIDKKGGNKPKPAGKGGKAARAGGPPKSGPPEELLSLIYDYKKVKEEINNIGKDNLSKDTKVTLKSLKEELKEIGDAISLLGVDPNNID